MPRECGSDATPIDGVPVVVRDREGLPLSSTSFLKWSSDSVTKVAVRISRRTMDELALPLRPQPF